MIFASTPYRVPFPGALWRATYLPNLALRAVRAPWRVYVVDGAQGGHCLTLCRAVP